MESFIIFENRLNNFWVIKSREYYWKEKKNSKMSGFFRGFLCSRIICSFGFI